MDARYAKVAVQMLLEKGGGDLFLVQIAVKEDKAVSVTPEQRGTEIAEVLARIKDMSREGMIEHLGTHPPKYGLGPTIEDIYSEMQRRACFLYIGHSKWPFFLEDLSP
jgi:hypothetical protein